MHLEPVGDLIEVLSVPIAATVDHLEISTALRMLEGIVDHAVVDLSPQVMAKFEI